MGWGEGKAVGRGEREGYDAPWEGTSWLRYGVSRVAILLLRLLLVFRRGGRRRRGKPTHGARESVKTSAPLRLVSSNSLLLFLLSAVSSSSRK
jgi:hypothetical protein